MAIREPSAAPARREPSPPEEPPPLRVDTPLSRAPATDPPHPQPDPQTLYNRAREAGAENRKLLVSLATGSLAFLFVGLTQQQSSQEVTLFQKTTICLGLLFLALAVFSGVFAFQVDAWRNYA